MKWASIIDESSFVYMSVLFVIQMQKKNDFAPANHYYFEFLWIHVNLKVAFKRITASRVVVYASRHQETINFQFLWHAPLPNTGYKRVR